MPRPYVQHTRGEWAGFMPVWTPMPPVLDVFIHHLVTPLYPAFDVGVLRNLERAEMARGDGLIALAYHLVTFGNGERAESRPANARGGATYGHNPTSLAIALAGNFQGPDQPTEDQLESAAEAIAIWRTFGRLLVDFRVWGHRDVFPTACCGDALYGRLHGFGSIEARAHFILDQGPPPEPPTTPATPTAPVPPPAPPSGLDWAAIGVYVNGLWDSITRQPLGPAPVTDRRPEVQLVQSKLGGLGFVVDTFAGAGQYLTATELAVKGFQLYHGLAVDGVVGPRTAKKLRAS